MDEVKAKNLAIKLKGKKIQGWEIGDLIDHGKSAAVFSTKKLSAQAALKVFDDELVTSFGASIQLKRIEREVSLVDKGHSNLVEIYGGGFDADASIYFLLMEFIEGENLSKTLNSVDTSDIPLILEQLASAARHLEGLGFVHRDVKPANIVWDSTKKRVKLLDLGVLGPIGATGSITDMNGTPFIGTLQYSSPEFLLRVETGTEESWRALTFYQLGAVLHDLIMRKPIFEEFAQPYARLVNAVQTEVPVLQSSSVEADLIELARACLLKSPEVRLKVVSWKSFQDLSSPSSKSKAKERVANRLAIAQATTTGKVSPLPIEISDRRIAIEVFSTLRHLIDAIRSDNSLFPPAHIVNNFKNYEVCIRLKGKDSIGLKGDFSIRILLKIVDAIERVVELGGICSIGMVDNETAPEAHIFFSGVIGSAAIQSVFEDFFYEALDKAQQISGELHDSGFVGQYLIFE
jgi:eukaryotic-like serine/threonine-protein kinase